MGYDGGLCPGAYCADNPLRYVDPSGLLDAETLLDGVQLECDRGVYAAIWLRPDAGERQRLLEAGGGYVIVTEKTKGKLWDCDSGEKILDSDFNRVSFLIEFVVRNGQVLPRVTQGRRPSWQYKQILNFQWKGTSCGTKGKFETTQVFKLFAGRPPYRVRRRFRDPNESCAITIDNPLTGDIDTIDEGLTYGMCIGLGGQCIDEISPVAEGWPILGGEPISRLTIRLVHAWDCECNVTEDRFEGEPPIRTGGPNR